MSNEDESRKLEALGRIKAGAKLADLVVDMGIKYPVLLKWRKELQNAEANGEMASIVDVDAVVVHRIAEEVKHDLVALSEDEENITAITGEVESATQAIDGLQLLNTKVQTTALKLADKIDGLTFSALEAKDVLTLVDALTKLQVAFFNKGGTNIQINNASGGPLGEFKGLMVD